MRLIKINVRDFTTELMNYPRKPTLDDMYKELECNLVEVVYLENGDLLWVDEEGWLKEPIGVFKYGDLNPMSGHALIIGDDGEGGHADCKTTLQEAVDKVRFAILKARQ